MELIFWISIAGILYAYLGYPLLLKLLISYRGERALRRASSMSSGVEELPSLSVIIAARNEEGGIAHKIEKTLQLRYGNGTAETSGVQVLVASDCSDDGTDDIVRSFAPRGVVLARTETRGGKETAQRFAIGMTTGEIILFTDAKITLNEGALENAARYFADSDVGAVSSIDRIEESKEGGSGEGFYIRYEMWLRDLESRFNSLVGLSGSCFAVRKRIAANIRENIPSDFALLIETVRQGLRGVNAPDVIGSYKAVTSERAEFDRKVRTVLRGMAAFFQCSETLNPFRFGIFSWQIASHKLARWLVPWFLLTAALSCMVLAFHSGFYATLFLCMAALYGAAAAAYRMPDLQKSVAFKVPLFFVVVNLGIFVAWIRFLQGSRTVAWDPSKKGA